GVKLDHMPVGIEDINLREAGSRARLQPHFSELVASRIFAVPFSAQELHRLPIAAHTDGEMHIARVQRLAGAKRRIGVYDQMKLLRGSYAEPRAGEGKVGAGDLFKAQNLAIKPAGALQIPDNQGDVMEGLESHI